MHSTSRQEVATKPFTAKFCTNRIFVGEGLTELKLLMSHLQQLFTLHWYRRLRHNNDYSTYQHQRQTDFSMEWPKKNF